ncbi:transporter substrate-binding domain-containing protein [Pseudoalteromonas neustonica]|uniref:Amino acid ABC transporter substrate-binding protein n=2 Tax=Pseudoalteromonas TaxID=53246 RepID=A0A0N1EEF4_9GAMM|nr:MULTISPECIES: transporter substrate-binding domain-containing protein [Pseudoalteromonas]KPH58012.1 amino acid ABC transporter substrate-binding protein [Pseudoalteromonas porphyrae]NMR26865.1 transporter substrate-binding domain-containing protein [Pseudoalteromonas sp. NEC-BIFX-2020_015]
MAKWCYFLFIIISNQCVAKLHVVTENFPPAQYLDENDRLVGYVADKVRLVLDQAKIDYTLSVNNWSTVFNTALRDPQTCIFSVVRSSERENKLFWVAEIAELKTYLYALDSKNITITELNDAKKMNVAVLKDNYSHQYLRSQGFEDGKNLMLINSFDNIFKIIKNRKSSIDLVVLPEQRVRYEESINHVATSLKSVYRLNVEQPPLYFACNKNLDPSIKSKLLSAFSHY